MNRRELENYIDEVKSSVFYLTDEYNTEDLKFIFEKLIFLIEELGTEKTQLREIPIPIENTNELIIFYGIDFYQVRKWVRECQKAGHVQQVAYSTYHDGISQICFNAQVVRTTISKEEIKNE